MSALPPPHKTTPQKTLVAKGQKPAAAYLGQLSAATYATLTPRMQGACRELVRLGEITIEGQIGRSGPGTARDHANISA